ncbi:MAG: gamma-glutamylcyclotransferase [Stappia sp.]|uniref:gamma-glutamylcyclotransferase family protein n=1 Tax=Stappia sp. TaxID=1870903 RepID=UPI000C5E42AF|nr:gamma-glutamylcyclotransferase family protein [Stappia sp.]MAA98331.1 gamma-glutamylcyclotransferase [Stappia sp.]MBM20850.1 gamma-glutamylcyclotransferase [Stappia sp.]
MRISYFGYGSLVNTRTLGEDARATAGTLSGWRREWRAWWPGTPDGAGAPAPGRVSPCTLTVRRDPASAIRGVLVSEPAERLAVLDKREHRYVRVDGIGEQFRCDAQGAPGPGDAFLYEADSRIRRAGTDAHPILQSYLDCVLAGFLAFWGEEGVRHFLETTDGWEAPILADRSAPLYPRAQEIAPDVLARFDALLAPLEPRYMAL